MEFKITFNKKEYLIKEGVILSFTGKYTIVNIRKKEILSRYSEYEFSLKRIFPDVQVVVGTGYTKADIICWLSDNVVELTQI
jgi:hypothetical protein